MKFLAWQRHVPLLSLIIVLGCGPTPAPPSPPAAEADSAPEAPSSPAPVDEAPAEPSPSVSLATEIPSEPSANSAETNSPKTNPSATGNSTLSDQGEAVQTPDRQAPNATCEVTGAANDIRFQGDCIFTQFDGNGSFSIQAPSGLIDGSSSVSLAVIEPGVAEVRGLTVDGINSRWGEARRSDADPACWVGSDFTICAR
ncbi:MAG: hypothetical protein VKJ64_06350 [Leptolyngbyaceae bacterium]|nr:hypothetical protein [Leptolyngbyaceae bacterium]